jgi:hypothetical protein
LVIAAVIDVTDRADVAVRLVAFEFCFAHDSKILRVLSSARLDGYFY